MAADFIFVDASNANARYANQLLQLVNQSNSLRSSLQVQKDRMDEMITNGDYTMLEMRFGLQAGDGIIVYGLLTGALSDMEAVNIAKFGSSLG